MVASQRMGPLASGTWGTRPTETLGARHQRRTSTTQTGTLLQGQPWIGTLVTSAMAVQQKGCGMQTGTAGGSIPLRILGAVQTRMGCGRTGPETLAMGTLTGTGLVMREADGTRIAA